MATIRLVPSTYAVSNSSYVTVTDAANMYTNTDSTTYASLRNTRSSTSNTYYVYIRGFNFDDVPSEAEVSDFTIKLRGYESYMSTSSSYRMSLYNNTTAISNTTVTSSFSTTNTTFTFPNGSLTWNTLKGYGANFGIRVPLRRSSTSYNSYIYVYGAEIEVTYTVPNPRTITTTLVGNGTIDPSGTQTMYDDDEYELVVEPTNPSDPVTATKNGNSITLTQHAGGARSDSNVLGEYTLVSGSFNSGASYFEGLVGKGHTASTTTSNYYSSSSGTQVIFQYDVNFADIPNDATITNLYMMASGHAESTSNANEYMCVQLKSGNTNLSSQYNFKNSGSTSNSTQTINATTLPTVAQLENLVVECTLGYYGGAINGVTVFLEYETSGMYYTYSTTISGDMTIIVTIGSGSQKKIYIKKNGTWTECSKIYKKINGSWVEQSSSDWETVLPTTDDYRLIEI